MRSAIHKHGTGAQTFFIFVLVHGAFGKAPINLGCKKDPKLPKRTQIYMYVTLVVTLFPGPAAAFFHFYFLIFNIHPEPYL